MKRVTLFVLALSFMAACGRSGSSRPLIVGSKNFTEQIVLAELLSQHLEARLQSPVERRANLGGTLICHEAVRTGAVDLYVEYTGTALTAVLHEQPSTDPRAVLDRMREEYSKQYALDVGEPLGFDNSFAMVIRGDDAERLNLKTLSDAARVSSGWKAGFGYEFMERPDGYPGLQRLYNLTFAEAPKLMDLGLLYRALEEKQVDIVAGSATDGVIAARHFVVLEDDKHYFPPYQAVPVIHRDAWTRFPALQSALNDLGGRITAEEMRQLNYAVDGDHRDVRQVVAEFLTKKKL